jgi:hypothetical protein
MTIRVKARVMKKLTMLLQPDDVLVTHETLGHDIIAIERDGSIIGHLDLVKAKVVYQDKTESFWIDSP